LIFLSAETLAESPAHPSAPTTSAGEPPSANADTPAEPAAHPPSEATIAADLLEQNADSPAEPSSAPAKPERRRLLAARYDGCGGAGGACAPAGRGGVHWDRLLCAIWGPLIRALLIKMRSVSLGHQMLLSDWSTEREIEKWIRLCLSWKRDSRSYWWHFFMLLCHTTETADKNRKGVFFAFCAAKYFH